MLASSDSTKHISQVFDKDTDTNKEATFKLPRDTKNPTAFEKERHLGTYRTTQSMAYAPPPEVHLQSVLTHVICTHIKELVTVCISVNYLSC